MQLNENLLWMIDGPSKKTWDEEENKRRISFIHSLGQKCDSVGWSNLELSDPGSDEILAKIKGFCDKNGWKARGYYSRGYHVIDCQWYRLVGEEFKVTEISDTAEILKDQAGKDYRLDQIKAYLLTGNMPRESYGKQCVSEIFLNTCVEKQFSGLKYCWLRDIGKYKGTQYFAIIPEVRVPRMMYSRDFSYSVWNINQLKLSPKYKKIQKLGGNLPKLAHIFTQLEVQTESCYLQEDMPDAFFAYGYYNSFFTCHGDILIRRDAVEELISCKVLSEKQIRPVYLADRIVPGYHLKKTQDMSFPDVDVLEHRMADYQNLVTQNRPERRITEKDALQILRNAKKQRKEDFHGAMPQKQRELLTGTVYADLIPYYSICESGYLSNEYRLLSYQESLDTTRDVSAYLEKEEMKIFSEKGIVFAVCANGDYVMLTKSNEVIRISHEEPVIIGQWSSLAHFIAEEVA